MAAKRNIFTVVLLCLLVFYCEGWIIKRQVGSGCQSRTDTCVHTANLVQRILYGEGFESLVVNGKFAIPCSASVREKTIMCFRDNIDCLGRFNEYSLMDVIDSLCNNIQGFVNAAPCWNTGSVGNAMRQCLHDNYGDSCSIPRCFQRLIARIHGCTDQAGSLIANMALTLLQSNAMGC